MNIVIDEYMKGSTFYTACCSIPNRQLSWMYKYTVTNPMYPIFYVYTYVNNVHVLYTTV